MALSQLHLSSILNNYLGVDYLSEGALTESMSYVFGPVLKLLRSTGYEDGVNLDAAPYDWRIPVGLHLLYI